MDKSNPYYTCCSWGDEISISLTAAFSFAINHKSPYYNWKPHNPLPPIPTDYEAKPITMTQIIFNDMLPSDVLKNWDTTSLKDVSFLFNGNIKQKEMDLSMLNLNNVEKISELCCGCVNLKSIDLSNQSFSAVKTAKYIFAGCQNLEVIDISDCENMQVLKSAFWFYHLPKLKKVFAKNSSVAKTIRYILAETISSDNAMQIDKNPEKWAKVLNNLILGILTEEEIQKILGDCSVISVS